MNTNNRGFTLVELIVVMAVFIAVLTMAASSFNTILRQNAKLATSEESNIEGVIGLEMLRHDLAQTGFGLPWSMQTGTWTYSEAASSESVANSFNEASGTTVPRALIAGNNPTGVLSNTDYLVLKGTTLGLSRTSQRWTYVNYSSVMVPHQWASENLSAGDKVIVLKRSFSESGVTNQLVCNTSSSNGYFTTFSNTAFSTGAFSPAAKGDVYNIYGVDTSSLRMPFNRADYFVMEPPSGKKPARCAPNTGTLYKGVVNQSDGTLTRIPLLDCIADMQIVFGWDLDGDGLTDAYSNADGSTVSGGTISQIQAPNGVMGTAEGIRNSLKLIRVYILAQDGARDQFYTNSNTAILVGPAAMANLSHTYNLQANQMNYRWRVYRIIVSPNNLSTQ